MVITGHLVVERYWRAEVYRENLRLRTVPQAYQEVLGIWAPGHDTSELLINRAFGNFYSRDSLKLWHL